jgi:hypothetical protein
MKKRRSELKSIERQFNTWLVQNHNAEIAQHVEVLPLRRDIVTLLKYVRDSKVVGTQGSGNMPMKAVREVTACFINPPELEATIGEHTYRIRSEADLWPLYFLRIIAEVGSLITVAPVRRWRLTYKGVEFLDANPLLQVVSLLAIWWYEVNWLVAYPYTGMGEFLPPLFNMVTLDYLLSLPVGMKLYFKDFANELIEETGLSWTANNNAAAAILLRGSIARMVIHIIANFGLVEREYKEEQLGKETTPMLDSFEITPFGRAFLEAMVLVKA